MSPSDEAEEVFLRVLSLRRLVVREFADQLAAYDNGGPFLITDDLRALLKAHAEAEGAFRLTQIGDDE